MTPDATSPAPGPQRQASYFPFGRPPTFEELVESSALVVAAVRADPPRRELSINTMEYLQDGRLGLVGPPMKTTASRWLVTATVVVGGSGGEPPANGSVIEVVTADLDMQIFEHAAYHRPDNLAMTISRTHPPGYGGGLPGDHAGEALLMLERCHGRLAKDVAYRFAIDGGILPVARRAEVEALWLAAHPAPPAPPTWTRPRRWWWPW